MATVSSFRTLVVNIATVCLPACLSLCQPVCLTACLSTCLSVSLPACLSHCLFVRVLLWWGTSDTESVAAVFPLSNILSFKACTDQNIASHAAPAARNIGVLMSASSVDWLDFFFLVSVRCCNKVILGCLVVFPSWMSCVFP